MVIELNGGQFGLKSQVWFQSKIARPEVQLPLYYIHFEINTRSKRFWLVPLHIETIAVLSKSETRNTFTSHFENMSTSCQRHVIASCYWLICFTVLFSLAGKKMRFRAKNSATCEKIALLRANQIARITSDFKADSIKSVNFRFRQHNQNQ